MFAYHAQRQTGVQLEIGDLSEGERRPPGRLGPGGLVVWELGAQPSLCERHRGELSVPLGCNKNTGWLQPPLRAKCMKLIICLPNGHMTLSNGFQRIRSHLILH